MYVGKHRGDEDPSDLPNIEHTKNDYEPRLESIRVEAEVLILESWLKLTDQTT